MSLWICAEHGLYGGQALCPRCGASGVYAKRAVAKRAVAKRAEERRFQAIDFAGHKTAFRERVKRALTLSQNGLLAQCHFDLGEPDTFKVVDAEGEHDPCYLVLPGGSMLPINHFADELTDVCRAVFIAEACNAALASAMSAFGQDPEEGLEAKPASAVGEAETPNA